MEREDVYGRTWWRRNVVALYEDSEVPVFVKGEQSNSLIWITDGTVNVEKFAELHIGWVGNAKSYPAWQPSGVTPNKLLYYHIRPAEWDAKLPYSKLERQCDEPRCINPFHAEWMMVKAGARSSRRRAMAIAEQQGVHCFDDDLLGYKGYGGNVRSFVLNQYINILKYGHLRWLLTKDAAGNICIDENYASHKDYDDSLFHLDDGRIFVTMNELLRIMPPMSSVQEVLNKRMDEYRAKGQARHKVGDEINAQMDKLKEQ